ncbi:unnamed protein product [Callosobruchus maculatus]|uniref:Uncharacterized protein n=1 Tax=Callosobruchus maculatus TaxID=64391 RepID=A0A653CEA4_CALMS|nr:unnamed protein product [Callosobruchus maculatus]
MNITPSSRQPPTYSVNLVTYLLHAHQGCWEPVVVLMLCMSWVHVYFESVGRASGNEPFSKVKIQCKQACKSTYLFLCSNVPLRN